MTIKTVSRDFPVTIERDVVVVGGGTAGSVAAIAAARNGAGTLLIESSGGLGGTGTIGGVAGFHGFRRHWRGLSTTAQVIRGMAQEIHDRLIEIGGLIGRKGEAEGISQTYDPELYKLLMEQMCEEAGVELLYQTYVIDAITDGNIVKGVTFVNKSGKGAALAKVVIDASGDADVAVSAGAKFTKGRINKIPMPMTLNFIMGGVDWKKARDFLDARDELAFLREAHSKGDLSLPPGAENFGRFCFYSEVLREGSYRNELAWLNTDMVYNTDATDAKQMTKAWIYAKKRVYEIANFLRKYVPGSENGFVLYTFPMMGIRDSRNILGDYTLTDDDFKSSRRFPDVIGRSGRAMNVHPPTGLPRNKKEYGRWKESGEQKWDPPFWTELKKPFDIPYRALLPKGLENILVAGRCIAAEGLIQGSIRGQPQCIVTGQAAGTAAAIAVRDGVTPRNVDIRKLQALLRDQGADLGQSILSPQPIRNAPQ